VFTASGALRIARKWSVRRAVCLPMVRARRSGERVWRLRPPPLLL